MLLGVPAPVAGQSSTAAAGDDDGDDAASTVARGLPTLPTPASEDADVLDSARGCLVNREFERASHLVTLRFGGSQQLTYPSWALFLWGYALYMVRAFLYSWGREASVAFAIALEEIYDFRSIRVAVFAGGRADG